MNTELEERVEYLEYELEKLRKENDELLEYISELKRQIRDLISGD